MRLHHLNKWIPGIPENERDSYLGPVTLQIYQYKKNTKKKGLFQYRKPIIQPLIFMKNELNTHKIMKKTTRWAPTSYKWSYNLYKWPYKWVTGVITVLT